MKTTRANELLKKWLRDPAYRGEYEALAWEFASTTKNVGRNEKRIGGIFN